MRPSPPSTTPVRVRLRPARPRPGRLLLAALPLGLFLGCVTSAERRNEDDFYEMRRTRGEAPEVELDGSYAAYVRYAMAHSPELRGDFERWRAATLRVLPARTLPEPIVTYGVFLRSPETRVGPQRQRVGLRQMIPWPARLEHAAAAAANAASSAGRRFDARAVEIRRKVAEAYWNVWYVHRAKIVEREERGIVASVEETLRARVAVGQADLAHLSQVGVRLSRLDDRIDALDETERQLAARLLAVIGAPGGDEAPIEETPPVIAPPGEPLAALLRAAAEHPRARAMLAMAEAHEEQADAENAARLPSMILGFDWIETGPARNARVSDSGKDPVMVSLGLTIPIWLGAYADREEAALAEASASRADAEAVTLALQAELRASMAALRDSARRVRLYRHTLIPLARATYESVLGSYQTGRTSVADILLADQDLLQLSLAEARASADHAVYWARVEAAAGRPIRSGRSRIRDTAPERRSQGEGSTTDDRVRDTPAAETPAAETPAAETPAADTPTGDDPTAQSESAEHE